MLNIYLEYTKNPNAAMVSNIKPRPVTIYGAIMSTMTDCGTSGLTS